MTTDVVPPWRKSRSSNVYCPLNKVPNEIGCNLRLEDNYVREIGEFTYKVRVLNDNVLVFRECISENKRISYCKICAQNGYPEIPIKWQKSNGKWVPFEYDDPIRVHSHLQQGVEDEK